MKGFRFALVAAAFSLGAQAAMIPATLAAQAAKFRLNTNPEHRAHEAKRTKKFNEKRHKISVPKRFLGEDLNDNYGGTTSEDYGFDMTQISIKFNQCATVETYSDEMAQNEGSDTVLMAKRFAIFSLCPTDQCSSDSSSSSYEGGCSNNNSYGEYVVSLDEYLSALLENEEEHVIGYCNYCNECATIESAKAFWKEVESYRETALKTAEANYEDWYSNNNVADDEDQYDQTNNVNGNQDNDIPFSYYLYLRNGGAEGYATNYYQNNYSKQQQKQQQQQGQASENEWDNSSNNADYWNFQADTNDQPQNNPNAWASLGGSSGNFYGYKVVNGYMDENGDFSQDWGYVNCNGEFVSLQDNDQWDECLWGEQPDDWDGVTMDTESCNEEYTASCYSQYDACTSILNAAEATAEFSIKDFVECTPVDNPNQMSYENNNYQSYEYDDVNKYYIGPSCSAGGHQISLAVYQDEFCSTLLDPPSSETITVASLLGYTPNFMEDTTNLVVPQECIPCGAGNNGDGDGDDNNAVQTNVQWYETEDMNGGNDGNYAVEPMCSTLYELSAKCLHSSSTAHWWYEENEQDKAAVCDFIDTLKSNTYDENGQVILVNSPTEMLAHLSTLTKLALAVLALAVTAMCVYACFLLHNHKNKNSNSSLGQKKRRRGDMDEDLDNVKSTGGERMTGLEKNAPLI